MPARSLAGSDTGRCTPLRKASRKSQLRAAKSAGSGTPSLSQPTLSRARIPGCADVVTLGRSHEMLECRFRVKEVTGFCYGRTDRVAGRCVWTWGLARGVARAVCCPRGWERYAFPSGREVQMEHLDGGARWPPQQRRKIWCCTLWRWRSPWACSGRAARGWRSSSGVGRRWWWWSWGGVRSVAIPS